MKKYILGSIILFIFSFNYCLAQTQPSSSALIPSCATNDGGCTNVNDLLQVGINVVQLIFALAGSLALAFFIYGGIMWLISSGNPERVKKGTEIIKNAVIGLVIIFCSYMIINFVMTTMGYKADKFNPWNTAPSGSTSNSSSNNSSSSNSAQSSCEKDPKCKWTYGEAGYYCQCQ